MVLWSILISPGEAFTEPSSTGKWRCSTHPALQIHQGEDGKGNSSSLPVIPWRLCPPLVAADSFPTKLRQNWCPCDGKPARSLALNDPLWVRQHRGHKELGSCCPQGLRVDPCQEGCKSTDFPFQKLPPAWAGHFPYGREGATASTQSWSVVPAVLRRRGGSTPRKFGHLEMDPSLLW